MNSQQYRSRTLVPQIRLGDATLDNFKFAQMGAQQPSSARLPLDEDNNEDAIRQAIWNETNNRYKFAVDMYQRTKAQTTVNVEEEDKAPYFSDVPVEKYYEAPLPVEKTKIDLDEWAKRLKEISAVFKNQPGIMQGDAMMIYTVERRYFVNSEGTEVVQNLPYARIMVFGETKADDGMELPLNLSYFAYDPKDLPSNDKIIADAKEMVKTLEALRVAPMVDPYTGPALLSGPASGVFFHEIFGHRIEGQRMKSDKDAQTFKKMIGEYVLPPHLQVFSDPTLKNYADQDMNGYYKYDRRETKRFSDDKNTARRASPQQRSRPCRHRLRPRVPPVQSRGGKFRPENRRGIAPTINRRDQKTRERPGILLQKRDGRLHHDQPSGSECLQRDAPRSVRGVCRRSPRQTGAGSRPHRDTPLHVLEHHIRR